MLVLLVLAAIVDASLALLLVAVSGFVLGPGPESSNGDPAAVISWTVALIGCIAAPIAGFIPARLPHGRHRGSCRAGTALGGALPYFGGLPPLLNPYLSGASGAADAELGASGRVDQVGAADHVSP